MKTNRRGFFKVLGVGAVGAAVLPKKTKAKPKFETYESEWPPVRNDEPREYVFETVSTAMSTPTRWRVSSSDGIPVKISGEDE